MSGTVITVLTGVLTPGTPAMPPPATFALGGFEMDYLFLMLIIGFVGTIWLFLDSFSRFNFFVAAVLVGLNITLMLTTTIPLVFFLYALFVVGGHIAVWRRTKIDTRGMKDAAEGFGRQRESKDAAAEAARLGLPSVFGDAGEGEPARGKRGARAGARTAPSTGTPEDEVEHLIAAGLYEDALRLAEERLKVARRMNDLASVARWRSVIDRLRSQLGDLAGPE